MRNHYKDDKSIKYLDLEKTFKLASLNLDKRERIYKIRETITTPKLLNFPYLSTDYNNKNQIPIQSHKFTHQESTQEKHPNYPLTKKLKKKDSSTQTPKKNSNKELKYSFITKEYYPMPIQPSFSNIISTTPYQLVEVLSDVVGKVSDNLSNATRINIMRSEYLINKINKENQILHNKLIKSRKEIKSKEEREEQYDTVVIEDNNEIRLKYIIRNYLRSKDNKLNQRVQLNASDKFFVYYDNKINFIYDVYTVPFFKNKFIRFNFDNIEQMKQFNSHNYIDPGILRYLYRLRIIIQKEKDDSEVIKKKREAIAEDNNIPQQQGQAGKVISELVNKDNTNILKEADKEAKSKNPLLMRSVSINPKLANANSNTNTSTNTTAQNNTNDQNNIEIQKPEEEIYTYSLKVYEMEDFFIHKYIRYESIGFANEKERDFIFNKFHDLSFKDYYSVHIPKVMTKL